MSKTVEFIVPIMEEKESHLIYPALQIYATMVPKEMGNAPFDKMNKALNEMQNGGAETIQILKMVLGAIHDGIFYGNW